MRAVYSIILLLTLVLSSTVLAQDYYLVPNEGQWEGDFDFQVKHKDGALFIQEDGMRIMMSDFFSKAHHAKHDNDIFDDFQTSNVFMEFIGNNHNLSHVDYFPSTSYSNFILGNDPSKWKSQVYSFKKTRYSNLYDGIDVEYTTVHNGLKYNYILKNGASISDIKQIWKGANRLEIKGGKLYITTAVGVIEEAIPESFIYHNGKKSNISVEYKISGNEVTYVSNDLPSTYDSLVIDPVLTFSTFSGSTADNWGTTACPDKDENAIGGGITFNPGYPTTPGSFMGSYQGGPSSSSSIGSFDITISKFSSDGSSLMYATYIGGSDGNEIACSMIIDNNNDLYIYGATSSTDFPVSNSAYQATNNGGNNTNQNGLFFNGTDIFVFKLTEDGTSMLASTYVGGTDNDGLNLGSGLVKNYGDQFRGEINLDGSGNPVIVSSTRSSDFPMSNAFDNSLNGNQDGIILNFSQDLSSLLLSSFVGGSEDDALYGMSKASDGSIYATGGTRSSDIPQSAGGFKSSNSGVTDGFIIKINNNNLIQSTYIGTSDYDQTYFIDLDLDDYVYVFGQSDGGYPFTPGLYNNSGGGQFIHKLENNLQASVWSTRIGGSNGKSQISPTAFLVSDCYEIFITGWGGETNLFWTSTTDFFPVTNDAVQPSTNGSNFYVALYEPDMADLEYATFIGGGSSSFNHVDGGTSRFSKKGIIYHAVCASCGNPTNGFTTTAGAYSTSVQSPNCNMAVFKFDLSTLDAAFTTNGDDQCFPNGVQFTNNATPGYVYEWGFGDGVTTNDVNPFHTYPSPGVYDVYLAVYDTTSCEIPDTARTQITISDPSPFVIASPDTTVCPGTDVNFSVNDIYNGTFTWTISDGDFNPITNPENPSATINSETIIGVTVNYACGVAHDSIVIGVYDYNFNTGPDTALCLGESVQISTDIGASWLWSPANTLNDATLQSPTATPNDDTYYHVQITTNDNCILEDSVLVEIDFDIPMADLPDTTIMCDGSNVNLTTGEARTYNWFEDYYISDLDQRTVNVNPPQDTTYYVDLTNACGYNIDSTFIDVIFPDITASPDTIICPSTSAHLFVTGAETYSWTPAESLVGEHTYRPIAAPQINTNYVVQGIDEYGCIAYDTVRVSLFQPPTLILSPDYYGFVGDEILLEAEGSPGVYEWKPSNYLSCSICQTTYADPPKNQTYTVVLTDTNGCKVQDQVTIYFDGIIYVPNAFTPDGDDYNNTFGPEGGNITDLEFLIFNRWGELLFESHDMSARWDGRYRGLPAPIDVYVWKLTYTDVNSNRHEMYGHVTIVR